MNREIKFRAWNSKSQEMFSVEEMTADQMALLPDGHFANIHSADTRLSVIYPTDVMVPMQFTGLTDHQGVEVYEGDVLRIGLDNEDMITDWVEWPVFWCADHCRWEIGGKKQHQQLGSFADEGEVYGLVIGNIYENPELLK